MYPRRAAPPAAFTLVELLVAMAITVVILTLLFRVLSGTTAEWQRTEERIDTVREARAGLQILARDLARAAINNNPPMLVLDNDRTDTRTDSRNQEAYAITSIPNNGKSDLCAVGYYCVWDDTNKAFTLKRLLKNSDLTFTNLRNGYAGGSGTPTFSGLFSHTDPAATSTNFVEDDVAAYVWDLQFKPGDTLVYPQTYPAPTATPSPKWNWVEVQFKAMSATAGQKLRGLPITRDTWFDPTSTLYRNVILPYEQQFVTRVTLQDAN